MNKDFRRNVLTTIDQLIKKIYKIMQPGNQSAQQSYFSNILSDVGLLRSDLILILNQNFYLQCKLSQKEKIIDDLQKRYEHLQENSKLYMRMAQIRYQKLKNNNKYDLFMHTNGQNKQQKVEETVFSNKDQCKQFQSLRVQQLPTPKKIINFREVKSSLENRSTLSKGRKKQVVEQDLVITEKFDAQTRVGEGIKSEQNPKFDENFSQQKSKSNELNRESDNNKKRRGNSTARKIGDQSEKCKQEELKMLVSQQWKVPPLRQRYFCTDLQ